MNLNINLTTDEVLPKKEVSKILKDAITLLEDGIICLPTTYEGHIYKGKESHHYIISFK